MRTVFYIHFVYRNTHYQGIVEALNNDGEGWYNIDVESTNHQDSMHLILRSTAPELADWYPDSQSKASDISAFDEDQLEMIRRMVRRSYLRARDEINLN